MVEEQRIEQERQSLRARNQVRLLTEAEEGQGIDRVPPGVYGFAHAPGTEALPLFRQRTHLAFEVHKKANGEVDLLGLLEASQAEAVESGGQDIEIRLGADPTPERSVLVSIPTERILRVKEHSNRDGQGLILQVAGFR